MDSGSQTRSTSESGRRCVVWHRPGAVARAELVRALSSRGLGVETSGSGHEVLAMGCAQQQRIERGSGGGSGLIVVLDGGDGDLPDQGRVLEAMERFCPSGLVWVYEAGANPPLRGVVEKGGDQKGGVKGGARVEPVVGSQKRAVADGSGPRLRLAGGASDGSGGGGALKASDVLDQDELAALLKPNEG